MDDPSVIWSRLLDRATTHGIDTLSANEQRIVRVNRFLVDYENGGLSGFLYNLSEYTDDHWTALRDTIAALSSFGRREIAALLQEALVIVERGGPRGPTWRAFIDARDADGRLVSADRELADLVEVLWDDIALEASDQTEVPP